MNSNSIFFTDLMPAIYSIAITPWGDRTWPVWDEERKIYNHDRDVYEMEVNAKRRKVLLVCNMCSFDCFFFVFFPTAIGRQSGICTIQQVAGPRKQCCFGIFALFLH